MSKRRYKITVKSFEELAAAYELAVIEKIVPEHKEQKLDYGYVAGLLDRKIAVPGIEFEVLAKETLPVITPHVEVHQEVPRFIGGKK